MYMWRTVWNPLNVSNPFWGRLSAAPSKSPCSYLPPPSLVMAYRCALSLIRFMQYAYPSESLQLLRLPLPVPCFVFLARPMATDSPLLASAAGAVPSARAICNSLAHAHTSYHVLGKFSSFHFGNRYISAFIRLSALCSAKSALPPPSIFGVHTITQPIGQTFVPHNQTPQPLQ